VTGPFEKQVEKLTARQHRKMTIVQAAGHLWDAGHEMLGLAAYDLKDKTSNYRVRINRAGPEKIITSKELHFLIRDA